MERAKKTSRLKYLFYFFGAIILAAVILRIFVIEVYKVSKDSMNNSYFDGDRVVINKLSKKNISRNDVVVFHHKTDVYIKRCIGLPGEKLEIRKGRIFINNAEVTFPAKAILPDTTSKQLPDIVMFDIYGQYWDRNNFGPYTIPRQGMTIPLTPENRSLYKTILPPPDQITGQTAYTFPSDYFFLVGDNRPHSEDSRIFGAVNKHEIIGTASFVF
jgi:signal peptidase I